MIHNWLFLKETHKKWIYVKNGLKKWRRVISNEKGYKQRFFKNFIVAYNPTPLYTDQIITLDEYK